LGYPDLTWYTNKHLPSDVVFNKAQFGDFPTSHAPTEEVFFSVLNPCKSSRIPAEIPSEYQCTLFCFTLDFFQSRGKLTDLYTFPNFGCWDCWVLQTWLTCFAGSSKDWCYVQRGWWQDGRSSGRSMGPRETTEVIGLPGLPQIIQEIDHFSIETMRIPHVRRPPYIHCICFAPLHFSLHAYIFVYILCVFLRFSKLT